MKQPQKIKYIKKALRVFLKFCLFLLLFLVFVWAVFQLKSVQTFAAKKTADYYSNQLETLIAVESLHIDFFDQLILTNIVIEDREKETLAEIETISLGIIGFDWEAKRFDFSLNLKQPHINFQRNADDESFNYEFITDFFSTSGKREKSEWIFQANDLKIENGEFHLHDYHFEEDSSKINYSHLDLIALNLEAKEIEFKAGNLSAKVESLACIEENGFELERLSTFLLVQPELLAFNELTVQTFGTELEADISFIADSYKEYSDFIHNVRISSVFKNSLIDMKDLSFFVEPLLGLNEKVYLSGEVSGTIDKLSGKNIEIQLNSETYLLGDFEFRGLPKVQETFISLDVRELKTSAAGIRKLPYPPFKDNRSFPISSDFDRLKSIKFKGNFTGYYNDFVAYGKFQSALGSVTTDIALKENENKRFAYKGSVETQNFDIGELFLINKLGYVSFDLEVDGKGLNNNDINTTANGRIETLEFNAYTYKDIKIDGQFIPNTFIGSIVSKDENIDFSFNGKVKTQGETPISQFSLKVNNANLSKLKLFNQKDSLTSVSFNADLNLIGKDIDNLKGTASVDSVYYRDKKQDHFIERFFLRSQQSGNERNLSFKSSILDAELQGDFKLKQFADAYKKLVSDYIPQSKYKDNYLEIDEQTFNFEIKLKNTEPITAVLFKELSVDSATEIRGSFSNRTNISEIRISSPYLKYGKTILKDWNLKANSKRDTFSLALGINSFSIFGLNSLDDFSLNSFLSAGESETNILWEGINKRLGEGRLNFYNKLSAIDKIEMNLFDSYITINDSVWTVAENNEVRMDSNSFAIQNLKLSNSQQALALFGKVSNSDQDTLTIDLKGIDLNYISTLLPEEVIALKGEVNGETKMQNVYTNLSILTKLDFKDLVINQVEVGKAFLSSKWNPSEKSLLVNGNLGNFGDELIKISGNIYPLKEENSLDLVLAFKEFPIALLERYISDYLTDLKGTLSGRIKVDGEQQKPLFKGKLQLEKALLKVNYLNTYYSVNDEIIIEPDFIGFNVIDVVDENGKKAVSTGTIFHENYKNFNLDIGLEFKNFMTLNTTVKDNKLFYGRAITSGIANISGYSDQTNFEIDLTAERGTDFNIPLTDGVDVSSSDFLIFTNSPEYQKGEREEVDLSGIQLNFDLDITPDAKVKIIFDEQIGDVIKGQGDGDLKLEINTIGNFNIYGQYVVEQGDYLFTLQNVINKRFKLKKGSRISWDGDPYQARLDLQAVYNIRAPLIDLFPEDSTAGFRRRIPVELELQMTNYLLNPDISFDISIPTADENTKRRLESILYVNNTDVNRQEMNQQVFGLLVLNRFIPSAAAGASANSYERGTPGLNNGYEFLTNQLSNWFSRLSDQFDVGLKYRPADELNSNEVDLSLSTEVLDDRLILDGNIGYLGNSQQLADNNQNSNFIGEFSAEYKLSKDGRFRVKGFNRSTNNSLLQLNSPYTQGVGLFYREEFDTIGELWRKVFSKGN